ncbi:hypothetical protein DERF_010119 [Dermatophagoides farinae]|uniref:Uncharacterized protein n=1 Tax=Dermatophagoides farinae TaxID=6954 RepID=A0A922HXY9_DERFA|nr:hypothetical protein DERF_010119 [Dermatophagoides farinae]
MEVVEPYRGYCANFLVLKFESKYGPLSSSYKNNINIDIKILYIHCYRHQLYPQVPHQDQQIL